MKKKSGNSLLFFFGSVGLVILAIVLTGLINNLRSPGGTDVRTRASTGNPSLKVTASVLSVDQAAGTMVVSDLRFLSDENKDLGQWTVTLPASASPATLSRGKKVTITIDPDTFQIGTHTVRAIRVE